MLLSLGRRATEGGVYYLLANTEWDQSEAALLPPTVLQRLSAEMSDARIRLPALYQTAKV